MIIVCQLFRVHMSFALSKECRKLISSSGSKVLRLVIIGRGAAAVCTTMVDCISKLVTGGLGVVLAVLATARVEVSSMRLLEFRGERRSSYQS